MKKIDIKKLLVFIGIIVIIALLIFFIVKGTGKKKPTEEEKTLAENLVTEYYKNLTLGYATQYYGVELLFEHDKVTLDDLQKKEILNTAIKYASDEGFDISVPSLVLEMLEQNGVYSNIKDYSVYKAEAIRKAVKDLFGQDIELTNETSTTGYLYDFYYNEEFDLVLTKRNDVAEPDNNSVFVDYSIIETTKEKDKLKTTLAIYYGQGIDSIYNYAKDSNGENIIAEEVRELPTDKLSECDKYTFTLTKNSDGNYILESIEKVK